MVKEENKHLFLLTSHYQFQKKTHLGQTMNVPHNFLIMSSLRQWNQLLSDHANEISTDTCK
jgi:hypothetical protein